MNSVCLDEAPQDAHNRLCVAASVIMNPAGNMMKLNDTTVLPNIHGLAALVPLLFAPCAEMR